MDVTNLLISLLIYTCLHTSLTAFLLTYFFYIPGIPIIAYYYLFIITSLPTNLVLAYLQNHLCGVILMSWQLFGRNNYLLYVSVRRMQGKS